VQTDNLGMMILSGLITQVPADLMMYVLGSLSAVIVEHLRNRYRRGSQPTQLTNDSEES